MHCAIPWTGRDRGPVITLSKSSWMSQPSALLLQLGADRQVVRESPTAAGGAAAVPTHCVPEELHMTNRGPKGFLYPRWSRASVGAALALATVTTVVACTGSIDTTAEETAGGAGTGGGGPAKPQIPAADTGLRRLTRTEYLNSIRDLLFLSDTTTIANILPIDGGSEHFDNDAVFLKIDVLAVDRFDTAASAAVDAALAAGSASRSRLVKCNLAAEKEACARATIAAFARRAWRRAPLAANGAEVGGLMAALSFAAAQGDSI